MYLLGDIGGTKIRLILCSSLKDLNKENRLKIFYTSASYFEFLKLFKNFLELNSQFLKKIKKAVFGFAGMFDKKKEKLIYAPNLRDFEKINLKKDLEKIMNREVFLENDAALAGLGEAKFGAGKKFKSFGYITLSTGVGGAKIVNTRIDTDYNELIQMNKKQQVNMNLKIHAGSRLGLQKFAVNYNLFGFEPGHSFLLMNDFLFEVEELLGGENIRKIFGQQPEKIKDRKLWNFYHRVLLIFLINVSIFWSVDKIVLGGGITKSLDFKKLNLEVNKFYPLPVKIKIIKAKLGELSVLYGGYVIANN